jgi:poly(A) polymerase
VDEAFEARIGDVSGRGKLAADMREIWLMQPRFDKRSGQAPFALVEQPRFRAGFDFLRLRAQVGEIDEELSHWWETFSLANEAVRGDMLEAVRLEQQRKRPAGKGPGRAKAPKAGTAAAHPVALDYKPEPGGDAEPDAGAGSEAAAADAAPARKRRRRRKPAGAGSASADGARAADTDAA